MDETSADYFRRADALYLQIYRLRQSAFIVTHVGLGVWGKQGQLSEAQQQRLDALKKERTRVYTKAKRLQKQGK